MLLKRPILFSDMVNGPGQPCHLQILIEKKQSEFCAFDFELICEMMIIFL